MSKQSDDRPLSVREWSRAVNRQKSRRKTKSKTIKLQKFNLDQELGRKADVRIDKRKGSIEIIVKSNEIGKHFFPKNVKSVQLSTDRLKKFYLRDLTEGFLPDHLSLAQFPKLLDKKLVVRRRFNIDVKKFRGKDLYEPTTIFGSDQRYVFSDTSFPWCTCGKVETASGWGSGVMIGPRHMMTASHVINWGPNNTAGWVRFTPLKFDTSEPFGNSWATKIYSWVKADPSDLLNLTEGAFDYVVCVLNSRLGDITGWMGSRGYNTDWEGGDYWGHIGYPQDLSGGTRPSFIGYQEFTGEDSASAAGRTSFRIKHKIDVIPGQSGGPYFGWWSDEPWPRVVSVQSGQTSSNNSCGGGNPLSEIINFARNSEP